MPIAVSRDWGYCEITKDKQLIYKILSSEIPAAVRIISHGFYKAKEIVGIDQELR